MCFLILTTAEMVFEILTKMKRCEWRKDRGETWCLLASHRTNVSRGLESPFFRFRYKRWWRDGKKVELNERRRVKVHIFGLDASVTFLSPIISIREGVGETFADAITIIRGDVFNLQGKWGTKTASGLLFFVSLGTWKKTERNAEMCWLPFLKFFLLLCRKYGAHSPMGGGGCLAALGSSVRPGLFANPARRGFVLQQHGFDFRLLSKRRSSSYYRLGGRQWQRLIYSSFGGQVRKLSTVCSVKNGTQCNLFLKGHAAVSAFFR